MINDCSHNNPLVRDGTSQQQRFPKALDPTYAKVDERSFNELLLLIKKYAAEIQYFNEKNEPNGSWEEFFKYNIATLISKIGAYNYESILHTFSNLKEDINNNNQTKKQLQKAFDLLFSLCYSLEVWQIKSIDGYLFHDDLLLLIKQTAAIELQKTISIYKESSNLNFLSNTPVVTIPEIDTWTTAKVIDLGFTDIWWHEASSGITDWQDYYLSVTADFPEPVSGSLQTKVQQVYKWIEKILENLISVYIKLIQSHQSYTDDILENYSAHEPHMGLLIAFLKLYKVEQDYINKITDRHLKHYYQEVLQIVKKEFTPDSVHLIIELAKNIAKHKIKANVAFKAGKDDLGNEVLFNSDLENVVNKVELFSFKSIHLDLEKEGFIYDAPVANSKNGLGEEFEDLAKWKPFGQSQNSISAEKSTMQQSSVGYAIAAEIFRMNEGNRWFEVTIETNQNFNSAIHNQLNDCFMLRISGEEGWIQKNLSHATYGEDMFSSAQVNSIQYKGTNIYLKFTIEDTEPAIIDLNQELHDSRLPQNLPTIFLSMQEGINKYPFLLLKNTIAEKIVVNGGTDKKTKLLLQTRQGSLDLTKPFNPFGSSPAIGDRLVFGSRELFNKRITKLIMHGVWNGFPAAGLTDHYQKYTTSDIGYDDFKVSAAHLKNNVWNSSFFQKKNLFNGDTNDTFAITVYENASPLPAASLKEEPERYTKDFTEGFLRLELTNPDPFAFGHREYPTAFALKTMEQVALASQSNGSFNAAEIPKEPYTPELRDFYIEYDCKIEQSLQSSKKLAFINVYPFGYTVAKNQSSKLLPGFEHNEEGLAVNHNGELLIGLSKLNPPEAVNLLFKVAEGSEDPELVTPKVKWFYLSDNDWLPFTTQQLIADQTKNLLKTGLIKLSIPKECSKDNTLMPLNFHWLKAAVDKNTAAVCDISKVHIQSIEATFADNANDPLRLLSPLKEESIAKLKMADAKIKGVSQPYASFGGQPKETDSHYFLRVAERLRHKDRGITIWDYERLVLEEFPAIYKVKCVNHTSYGYYDLLKASMDSEFAPGYITIVVVPKTYNINAIDPFEPRVSKGLLQDITDYLKEIMPEWAAINLKVLNPQYEQVQVECDVAFYPEYADTGFYEKQLNDDIKKFLSPWVFEDGNDIVIGGVIRSSSILDFIEEQYYVDYVKNFIVNHYIDEVLFAPQTETVMPTTARSVLVTYHSLENKPEHNINAIVESVV